LDWQPKHDALVYRPEQLQRIIGETEDDDDLIKEVGAGYPRFEFEPFGSAYNRYTILVNVGGEFIGSLVKTIGKTKDDVAWHVAFLGKRQLHTYIPVATPEEGAQKLWQDHTGLTELPIVKEPYVPLPPDPDDPNHCENLQATAKNLVRFLSETEDEKDFDEVKDYGYDQLEMVVQALQKAGFKVSESRKHENVLYVTFSWPYTTVTSFLSGWRRAKEVMTPYISLRQGNYVVEKSPQTKVATCRIIKRIEEDPNIWKIKPQMIARLNGRAPVANPVWFDIFFSGQKVGEAYLPAFSGSEDTAERLREEMAQLDQTVPFVPEQWPAEGNAFGSGPAIAWWRKNRPKLHDPEINRHYFDRKLIGD